MLDMFNLWTRARMVRAYSWAERRCQQGRRGGLWTPRQPSPLVPRRRVSIACGGIEGRRVVGEPTEANHDDDASIHSGPRLIEPPPASVTYNLTWESMQPYVT